MSKIIIRECTPKDFSDIFLLLQQLWPNIEFHTNKVKEIFDQKLKLKDNNIFCVETDGKVVGFSSFSEEYNFSWQGKYGFIAEFVIEKTYRGKGIGTNLLNRVIEYAKEKGCKSVELNSSLYRTGAHEFFLKNRFEKISYLFYKAI